MAYGVPDRSLLHRRNSVWSFGRPNDAYNEPRGTSLGRIATIPSSPGESVDLRPWTNTLGSIKRETWPVSTEPAREAHLRLLMLTAPMAAAAWRGRDSIAGTEWIGETHEAMGGDDFAA
ncbi:hypothetical protein TgHK011_007297 [Trichoderma gracile]|nr:hypothetical protein TgHK011_007297 [Trichoderma gracile]